ncbi:MAG: M23 family metallopeptidase [Candidatus Taylorbacteria bacterium]|nr:M23 family metallopeptidase [Candidatus Taylorbacteria bacterium]
MIRVEGLSATTTVKSISFDGKALGIVSYTAPTAFYGIDINKKVGTYVVRATLSDGTAIEEEVKVGARRKAVAPLGIPEKLGGNTATSAAKLVDTLAIENASLLGLRTGGHAFWTKPFRYPVSDPIVTDEYGYSRKTVGQTITHKGTDFRAKEGTPILAMNRGVVRVAREGRNYGKTVVIDHGLGLQTFYMHLSKIKVNVGELVLPGQAIGLSGMTGYAESPHLHLTVRINDISVDPVTFLGFFR